MGMQVRSGYFHQHHNPPTLPISSSTASILLSLGFSSKITAKSSNVSAPLWDSWKPDNSPASTPFSDIIWPSAAIGVFAFSVFGPGWLARSVALAASIAFMVYTRSTHPSAASLPLLFIDGAKFHHLHLWYALFPGATGCIILCLIVSCYP
ncbi:integral membrane HPP family protein [Salix suchowensis]|nr:integral membrane HPP family protein [Salix suchowensis]